MVLKVLLLLLSVGAASTAVIMIKASTVHPVLLASLRLFVAAIVLTPVFVRDFRRHRASYTAAHFRASLAPGVVLGVHLMSWIVGARMTPTANASLIVNLMPLAMPFFLWFLVREPLKSHEVLATALALVGVVALTASDLSVDPTYFLGDVICFVSMLFYAFYLALGRRNRHIPTVWLYLVPLYYVAACLSMGVALLWVNPIQPYPAREVALILGLGIVPTVVGHSLLNYSMKHFRGQVVTVVNMGQFVFAGLMAYWFFGEVPRWVFAIAALCVAVAAWLVLNRTVLDEKRGARKARSRLEGGLTDAIP